MVTLTVGMATYDDFDGCYFSLQALRMYQNTSEVEYLVVDNFGCDHTQDYVEKWTPARYLRLKDVVGTSKPRDIVFREANTEAVLCIDCHVFLIPGAIKWLQQYYADNPDSLDLLQGPLLHDNLTALSTHFQPVWNDHMWGVWGTDNRGRNVNDPPFDIPMQGLGLFSCRKKAWLGFNNRFRGFGGEEGYIHEKFRQAGRRCLCLPWLRWMHRFWRPYGASFPLSLEDRVFNYLVGHDELGLSLTPVLEHFSQYLDEEPLRAIAKEALGDRDLQW